MATGSSDTAPSATLCEDDLGVLYEALYPARNKYRALALQIGVKISEIESVEMKESDPGDRLLQILAIRLKKREILTWKDINTVLSIGSVDESKIADAIKKKYNIVSGPEGSSEYEHEKRKEKEEEKAMHLHRMSEPLVQQNSDGEVSKRKRRKKCKKKESESEKAVSSARHIERVREDEKEREGKNEEKCSMGRPEREPVYKKQGKTVKGEGSDMHTPSNDDISKKQTEIATESDSETSCEESPEFVRELEEKSKSEFKSKNASQTKGVKQKNYKLEISQKSKRITTGRMNCSMYRTAGAAAESDGETNERYSHELMKIKTVEKESEEETFLESTSDESEYENPKQREKVKSKSFNLTRTAAVIMLGSIKRSECSSYC